MPLSFMNLYSASRGMRRNLRAGHAEALELPVVEAADDGLLADLADLGGFAGREHRLHAFIHPCRLRPARMKEVRARPSDRAGRRTESVRDSRLTVRLRVARPVAVSDPAGGAGGNGGRTSASRRSGGRASWRGFADLAAIIPGVVPISRPNPDRSVNLRGSARPAPPSRLSQPSRFARLSPRLSAGNHVCLSPDQSTAFPPSRRRHRLPSRRSSRESCQLAAGRSASVPGRAWSHRYRTGSPGCCQLPGSPQRARRP